MTHGALARVGYSDEERAEVLTRLALNGGNVSATAREMGMTRETIIKWRDAVAPALARQVSAHVADSADTLADMVSAELQHIGFGNLSDVVSWDENGKLKLVPSADLTPRQAALLSEIRVKRRRTVEAAQEWEIEELTVRTRDKLGALNSLAKIAGLMPTAGVVVNDNRDQRSIDLGSVPTDELERRIAAARLITGG